MYTWSVQIIKTLNTYIYLRMKSCLILSPSSSQIRAEAQCVDLTRAWLVPTDWIQLRRAGGRWDSREAACIPAACTCKIFWCGFVSSHHQVWHRHDQHYKWYHYQSLPGLVSGPTLMLDTRCLMPGAGREVCQVSNGDICGPHDDFFSPRQDEERATDEEQGEVSTERPVNDLRLTWDWPKRDEYCEL